MEDRTPKKPEWPPGPWHDEPDHVAFEHAGLSCILNRGPLGHWCGYVGVPEGHPWHGKDYNDVYLREQWDLRVHGGLTYAHASQGQIGKPDDQRWWIGFDCTHAGDLSPAMEALRLRWVEEGKPWAKRQTDVYRDLAYVRAETEPLAEQALEALKP